jgi:aminoglycoside 3-N-acetyltransferase
MFRQMPGVLRSLHPTHSVAAVGPLATWLTAGHEECSTPCGVDSPYAKLLVRDGRILFLGVGLQSNTAFHTAESLSGLPYVMRPEPDLFTLIDVTGQVTQKSVLRHQTGVQRRFAALEEFLVSEGVAFRGRVGEARCLLLRGGPFLACMMSVLKHKPDFLLERHSVTTARVAG